jgi:hypothetical protein
MVWQWSRVVCHDSMTDTEYNVQVLPCIKIVRNGEVTKTLIGFEDFGGSDDFTTAQLSACLATNRAIL